LCSVAHVSAKALYRLQGTCLLQNLLFRFHQKIVGNSLGTNALVDSIARSAQRAKSKYGQPN
jgi:hypothetical protein